MSELRRGANQRNRRPQPISNLGLVCFGLSCFFFGFSILASLTGFSFAVLVGYKFSFCKAFAGFYGH